MRTVNIGELKNQLSGYLQYVKNGEEVVIRERFFLAPAGNVAREVAVESASDSRGDW